VGVEAVLASVLLRGLATTFTERRSSRFSSRASISSCCLRSSASVTSAAIVTSNLPFDEWTSVFGSERLTGALLDRLTHHVHILELNGESYRLAQSKRRSRRSQQDSALHQTAAD
jgi:hypothetical protein